MKVLKDLKMKRVKMNVPADTGRKLNVHKTLRRRPGRLLNVLCTFNLRPVSTGKILTDFQICINLPLTMNKFHTWCFYC